MGKFGAGGSDQVNEPGDQGDAGGDHLQHMRSDASLTDPANSRLAQADTYEFDGPQFIKDNYGSDEGFLAAQPGELRQQLGLPEGASSEQVFRTMARQATDLLKTASPEYQKELLDSLQLERGDASEANILNAIVQREAHESGLGSNASYEQLEQSMHARSLALVKSGSLPIDTD